MHLTQTYCIQQNSNVESNGMYYNYYLATCVLYITACMCNIKHSIFSPCLNFNCSLTELHALFSLLGSPYALAAICHMKPVKKIIDTHLSRELITNSGQSNLCGTIIFTIYIYRALSCTKQLLDWFHLLSIPSARAGTNNKGCCCGLYSMQVQNLLIMVMIPHIIR